MKLMVKDYDPCRKIAAIKAIRDVTREMNGMGLKECKEFVESLPEYPQLLVVHNLGQVAQLIFGGLKIESVENTKDLLLRAAKTAMGEGHWSQAFEILAFCRKNNYI